MIKELIRKKRQGGEHDPHELGRLLQGYLKGKWLTIRCLPG